MSQERGKLIVRQCLSAVSPHIDFDQIGEQEPLLENRLLTSFQVVDLLLQLEYRRGRPIRRTELQPGSFRDIATLARVFVGEESP